MKVGDPKLDAIVKRPVKHLAQFRSSYPGLWRDHDLCRAEYRKETAWPQWCYAPVTVAGLCFQLPKYGGSITLSEAEGALVAVAAAATWRLTKGIYLFDETVFDALWETPVEGHLPVELLHRLPEWCVYVPFPAPREFSQTIVPSIPLPNDRVHGFFAHLDWQRNDGTTWLHLCLDCDHDDPEIPFSMRPISIKLVGNLTDACRPFRDMLQDAARRLPPPLQSAADTLAREHERLLIQPLVSILLWLCSAQPEISGLDPLRGLRTKKTKQGIRNFNADGPRVYEVAYRVGAALRLNREAVARGMPGDGSHASPRPHIRRAHWHSFWTGPRASTGKEQPTERKLVLKWIAPIAVCVGTDDTVIPTVHPVVLGSTSV